MRQDEAEMGQKEEAGRREEEETQGEERRKRMERYARERRVERRQRPRDEGAAELRDRTKTHGYGSALLSLLPAVVLAVTLQEERRESAALDSRRRQEVRG